MGVSRSTYYAWVEREPKPRSHGAGRKPSEYAYTRSGRKVSDEQIKEWLMEAIEGKQQAYGYLKLTYWLRQTHDLVINKKQVYRLCKELDVLRPQRPIRTRPPRRETAK